MITVSPLIAAAMFVVSCMIIGHLLGDRGSKATDIIAGIVGFLIVVWILMSLHVFQ